MKSWTCAVAVLGVAWLGCGDDTAGSGGAGGAGTTAAQSSSSAAGPTTTVGSSSGSSSSGPGTGGGDGGAASSGVTAVSGPTVSSGPTVGSGGDGGTGPASGSGGDGGAGDGGAGPATGSGGEGGSVTGSGGGATCQPLSSLSCARCPDVIGQPECDLGDLCDGNFGMDYTELVACACADASPCSDACDANLCVGGDISADCDACVHASCEGEMLDCLNNGPPEDNCGLDCNGLLNDAIVVEDGCQMPGALLMYDLLDCACDPDVGACVEACELSLCADNVPYGACRACVEAQCGDPFQACLDNI